MTRKRLQEIRDLVIVAARRSHQHSFPFNIAAFVVYTKSAIRLDKALRKGEILQEKARILRRQCEATEWSERQVVYRSFILDTVEVELRNLNVKAPIKQHIRSEIMRTLFEGLEA